MNLQYSSKHVKSTFFSIQATECLLAVHGILIIEHSSTTGEKFNTLVFWLKAQLSWDEFNTQRWSVPMVVEEQSGKDKEIAH